MALKIKFNSLETRLTTALLLMVILPAISIGGFATHAMSSNIRAERIKDVGQAADAKHNQLIMLLARQNARTAHLLSDLHEQCIAKTDSLDALCATRWIESYLASEGAVGAKLRKANGDSLSIGASVTRNEKSVPFKSGQLAKFIETGAHSNHAYFVSATDKSAGLQVDITYPSSVFESIFSPPPAALGASGETFMADGEGYFVTRPKYHATQGHGIPISAHPMQTCLGGQSSEVLDLDYRDVAIIHGFRFIPELGAACIMAHITQEEAFASVTRLEQRLLMAIALFSALLIIAIVYLAKSIVKPIKRLTKVARHIALGDDVVQAEVAGSDEISDLSTSFNLMTHWLRASQQQESNALRELQVMLDTSGEGFWKLEQSGHIVEANDAYCRLTGYAKEEVVGAHISKFEAIELTPEAVAAHVQHIVEHGHDRFETQHRHADGHLIDIEVVTSFIPESDYLIAFLHDVTERREIMATLRIAAAAFETQEAIVITDADSKILRVNHAFEEVSGYSAQEIIGQNPRIMQSGRHDEAFYRDMWSMLLATGKWDGEIWDKRKNGEIYPKYMTITAIYDEQHLTTHYVAVSSDISQRKQDEKMLHQLAFYDTLTSLPNRRLLLDRTTRAFDFSLRSGRYGALLFLDLDNFKTLNDTKGHSVGDLLLLEVARRLMSCVRGSDTVARLGGDEFVLVLESLSPIRADAAALAEQIAEKVSLVLSQPYLLGNYTHRSTPSIGIVLFLGHQETLENLLKYADTAMYQAKSAGRNCIRFYDPEMQAAIEARSELAGELHQALDKKQFCLHYQIQMDNSYRPLGAEVLLRWEHPVRGLVSPMTFIPLAEETGLIEPIGLWVLRTTCAQLKAWENNALTRDLVLAVNVSARQFHQSDFFSQVQGVLLNSGVNPSRLKLELTESIALKDVENTIAKMRELKNLGVSFSMDDFGTGYSSLQYLKRLPLDQIKIDRSFVNDITTDSNDVAIVKTIIAMGQALGLNVIAEGVETAEQRDLLCQHGCYLFQGYLFSRPIPVNEFEALLNNRAG
ncbi:MAG: EAL domain-containing protein [Gallionella sp.]|nr:EAL domain-containing protein [Gallionella sp.]